MGDLEIDLERKIAWVNGQRSSLPAKAVEVLCLLVEKEGEVVSKDELLSHVWHDSFVEEGVLPQNIYLVRKTLDAVGLAGDLIQTLPRRGYRFVGPRDDSLTEITIEREVLEQTYVSETEVLEDENHPNEKLSQTRDNSSHRRSHQSVLMSTAAALALLVGAAFFGMSMLTNSASPRPISEYQGQLDYEMITPSGRAFFVGLSRDGENAAYAVHTADNKYELNLHHLSSKSVTRILGPQEGQISNIQFSPDGQSIYYLDGNNERKAGVFRMPIYGGTPQLVTRDLTHHYMLSPDGEWIAFYRREPEERAHHLEVCRSTDCSEKRTVTTRSAPHGFVIWGAAPAWSSDGKKFAAAAHTRDTPDENGRVHLIEIDVETGEQRDIVSPNWYWVHQPYWSRDGRSLYAMVRETQGEPMQLWNLQYPSGEARNITNDQNDYREYRVASDESFILAATWSKAENLFLLSVDDPLQMRQLTFDSDGLNGASALCWTRDGKSLVFSKASVPNSVHLWLMDVETTAQRQLTFDEKAHAHYADTTPDGEWVVFGYNKSGKWHVWKVGLNGENLTQVTAGDYEAAPEVSPDGKWLYYLADGLRKQPIEGGESVKIMEQRPGTVRVSPADPNTFAAYYYDRTLSENNPWRFVLFNESDMSSYIDLNIPANIFFEWKNDGSGIYYSDQGESFNNIWFVDATDRSRHQITKFSDQRIGNFAASPDGKTFALSRGSAIGNVFKISPN